MLDVQVERRATRGCEDHAHLNNCGAALLPAAVVDTVIGYLKAEEKLGGYEAAAEHADDVNAVYASAGQLLGCAPTELAYCDSATRAWNTFVYSLQLGRGDIIVTSEIEFGSGLIALQHVAERTGARLVVVPGDEHGRIRLDELQVLLRMSPAVVAVTYAAAHSGAVNPVVEIGRLVRDTPAVYLVDACQAAGQMRVDVQELVCDALTITGRKWLRAPRGTGLLYVRDTIAARMDAATSDLVTADYLFGDALASRLKFRTDSRKFELWERNLAAVMGLDAAVRRVLDIGIDNIGERVRGLAQYARDGLADCGAEIWAPEQVESGVVGFRLSTTEPGDIKTRCAERGVSISTMADWDAPLDFQRRGASSVARVAPHYYNTTEEIDRFLTVIQELSRTA